jgi:hypothetical protein
MRCRVSAGHTASHSNRETESQIERVLSSIPRQALEAGRRQLRITHRILDRLMAKIGLDRSGIDPIGQLEAAGVAQHVRVDLHFEPSRLAFAVRYVTGWRGNAHDSRRIFCSGYLHRRTPRPRQDLGGSCRYFPVISLF